MAFLKSFEDEDGHIYQNVRIVSPSYFDDQNHSPYGKLRCKLFEFLAQKYTAHQYQYET